MHIITKTFIGLSLLVVILIVGSMQWLKSQNSYQMSGSIDVPGLSEPVTIWRSQWGVAHIHAKNLNDLWFGQGFLTAQHRLFQMEFYRRIIRGELAEIIGEEGLTSDRYIRALGLQRNATAHTSRLKPETRAFIQSYVDGVNSYREILGKKEKPLELKILPAERGDWQVEDVVGVMHFISMSHSKNFESELLVQQIATAVGAERFADLLPININPDRIIQKAIVPEVEASYYQSVSRSLVQNLDYIPRFGSNNWVVAGKKSTTGRPILSNDPHLDSRILPGPWHLVSFSTPDYSGAGLALSGIPGIFSGRSGSVAFGVTNAYGDVQDLYIETINPNDASQYLSTQGWRSFDTIEEQIKVKDKAAEGGFRIVDHTIQFTERGLVINDYLDGADVGTPSPVMTLRWVSAHIETLTFGIDQLMGADNCADVEASIAEMDIMMFNWVFADEHGCIGRRSSGAIPIRPSANGSMPHVIGNNPADDWSGYIPKHEMPGELNPARGWTGTANHDTRPDNYPYYYSSRFAPANRYVRLKELMTEHQKVSPEQQWAFMLDEKNPFAERVIPIMLSSLNSDEVDSTGYELLSNWDFFETEDSSAALMFNTLFHHLIVLTLEDDFDANLLNDYLKVRHFWRERFEYLMNHPDHWAFDIQTTAKVETMHDILEMAMNNAVSELKAQLGGDWSSTGWGEIHTATFVSPLRQNGFGSTWLGAGTLPQSGSGETLKSSNFIHFHASEETTPQTQSLLERYATVFMDSGRVVVDFSNNDSVQAVIPGGVASRQFNPYQKNLIPLWQDGKFIDVWLNPELAEKHSISEMKLLPLSQ